ncbi:MAG TPA: glycosyltransferase [Actinomycetota bacterium]|nr:glycosyltransferase [Actinomycetota bacterium]
MADPGTEAEARRLAEERAERRTARDFAAADALRDRIRELGFEVVDAPGGFELRPLPAAAAISVQWVVEGWPEDVARGIAAFDRHHPGMDVEHVVVDAVGGADPLWPPSATAVTIDPTAGWGAARAAGLAATEAPVVVAVDGSIEPEGDVLTPLADALADPAVGVAGPFGIVTDDLREFRASDGPEVDAIEGYCMAFRRETLDRAGGFDPGFRFYRVADIELSFRIRDLGLRAVVVDVPVRRHEHRMWTSTPEAERDRLSKRNFYRFLDRYRDRFDLCVTRRAEG